jgi:hypothetical protein
MAPEATATATTTTSAGSARERNSDNAASRSVAASLVKVSRYDESHHTATLPTTAPMTQTMNARRRAPGLVGSTLSSVAVEALARLPAEVSGGNHSPEQRAWPVLGIAKAVVQDLEDGQTDVETDEVGER